MEYLQKNFLYENLAMVKLAERFLNSKSLDIRVNAFKLLYKDTVSIAPQDIFDSYEPIDVLRSFEEHDFPQGRDWIISKYAGDFRSILSKIKGETPVLSAYVVYTFIQLGEENKLTQIIDDMLTNRQSMGDVGSSLTKTKEGADFLSKYIEGKRDVILADTNIQQVLVSIVGSFFWNYTGTDKESRIANILKLIPFRFFHDNIFTENTSIYLDYLNKVPEFKEKYKDFIDAMREARTTTYTLDKARSVYLAIMGSRTPEKP